MNTHQDTQRRPDNLKHIILIGSGKGGVGKTTVSVNLALALSQHGHKVALLDADIYGPNVPLLLGIRRKRQATVIETSVPLFFGERPKKLIPTYDYSGIKVMSAGFLVGEEQVVRIGSSMMIGKTVESLIWLADWGDSDTMLIDLPPGSDEPMATIVGSSEVTGGIVVTTPQDFARLDAKREIRRMEGLSLPILGIVENMSYFICHHCGKRQHLFPPSKRFADLGCPILAEIPFDSHIGLHVDNLQPEMSENTNSFTSSAFSRLANTVSTMIV